MACAAAFAVGDARDGARGFLNCQCGFAQRLGIGFAAVVEIKIGSGAFEQQLLRGEPGIGIFGGFACHGDAALDQLGEFAGIHVGGRYAGAALADEDAQRNILPFRPFDILERAKTHRDRGGGVAIVKRVGGVGAGFDGGGAQHLRAIEGFGNGQHFCALYGAGEAVKIKVGGGAPDQPAILAIASVAAIAPLTHRKGSVSAAAQRRRTSRRNRACNPQLASAWRLRWYQRRSTERVIGSASAIRMTSATMISAEGAPAEIALDTSQI